MILYKQTKNIKTIDKQIEKLLIDRIVNPNQLNIFIPPFCLFSKKFYKDLRESQNGLFDGTIENGIFKLSLTSKVFSTRTRLPLKIVGK